jgi:hypothetical protein
VQSITRKSLLEKLDKYIDNGLTVNVKGNILFEITLNKFSYEIKEDVLTIKETFDGNAIGFNLNNINFMAIEGDNIICTLNDTKDTIIEIRGENK